MPREEAGEVMPYQSMDPAASPDPPFPTVNREDEQLRERCLERALYRSNHGGGSPSAQDIIDLAETFYNYVKNGGTGSAKARALEDALNA